MRRGFLIVVLVPALLSMLGSLACGTSEADQQAPALGASAEPGSPLAAASVAPQAAGTPPTGAGVSPTEGAAAAPRVIGASVPAVITYIDLALEGGPMACGGRYQGEDPTIAAATAWPCGTKLRVCHGAACVVVTVQDTGHMGANWVDLSAAAFRQLAPLAEVTVMGTVEVLRE